VRVGVRVQIMGVRVDVGVADNAAMNACLCAVCVTAVARRRISMVAVEDGTIAVGGGVRVATSGKVNVDAAVAGAGAV
jgi:hypothetical protein